MPLYSVKLSTYDPAIIAAFDRLRKNRKQAAFTHEALKDFLTTEKGCQVLLLMEGRASESPSTISSLPSKSTSMEIPAERVVVKTDSVSAPQSDGSNVLESILE